MVAVIVRSQCAYGERVTSSLCGTATTCRGARDAQIATTGDDCGFPLVMWTWMIESMLIFFPFRQEFRSLSPNSDISVDFGVPKGG